jgi:cyclohexyl-isocyanide hydratase
LNVGFVLFPKVTQLDLTGPLQVLYRMPGARIHVAAKTAEPVSTDCGIAIVPTTSFSACPQLDAICVPGGFGVAEAFADPETLAFVADQGAGASWVTSVCTGAFVLGVAGLLRGRRATTHWAYHPLLERVGAVPEVGRVVRDGPVVTGGGVTAGIDFAFAWMAEVVGPEEARKVQLALEYDPAPPFAFPDLTVPRTEGPVEAVRAAFAPRVETFGALLDQAVARVSSARTSA